MRLFIILVGLLVLGFIFLKRYLMVEKGVNLHSLLFRKRSFMPQSHHENEEKHELTANEMIPHKESVDPKSAAKAMILFKKGEIYLNKGDLKNAERIFIEILSLDPSSIEAHNKLGLIYLRQEQFGKAENIYRKLVVTVTDEPAYFSNLGMALYSQKKLEDAKQYYKKAIEIDGARAGRFFSLGQILHELEELDEALVHLKKAVELEPRNIDYALSLAHLYVGRQMSAEAQEVLRQILKAEPGNEEALGLMGKVEDATGRNPKYSD